MREAPEVGCKQIGGEAASLTNPEKVCAGKCKKIFRPSDGLVDWWLQVHKFMAPDEPSDSFVKINFDINDLKHLTSSMLRVKIITR